MSALVLNSTITCPVCRHREGKSIPVDACVWFYECEIAKQRSGRNPGTAACTARTAPTNALRCSSPVLAALTERYVLWLVYVALKADTNEPPYCNATQRALFTNKPHIPHSTDSVRERLRSSLRSGMARCIATLRSAHLPGHRGARPCAPPHRAKMQKLSSHGEGAW
jgi:hypothetical protein